MTKIEKPHKEIGIRLRAFREIHECKQKDLAEKHGFSPTRYTNWETGERRIPVEEAAVLEKIYGLTLDFIYLGKTQTLPFSLATLLSEKLLENRPSRSK